MISNSENNYRNVVMCVYLLICVVKCLWYANNIQEILCIVSSLSNNRALSTLSNGKQQKRYRNDLFIHFIVISFSRIFLEKVKTFLHKLTIAIINDANKINNKCHNKKKQSRINGKYQYINSHFDL